MKSAAASRRYTIRDLSRITGFSSDRIRVWERRYELLKPERLPNGYRVYGGADLERLLHVKRALAGGASIGEIAGNLPAAEPDPSRSGWIGAVLRTAREGAPVSVREILEEAADGCDALQTWQGVVEPLMAVIGDRWVLGRLPIWLEHLVSREVRGLLEERLAEGQPGSGPVAALFCPAGELHELPLLGVAARLQSHGYRTILLGADLPLESAREFALHHRPALLGVSLTHLKGRAAARQGAAELATLSRATVVPVLVGGRAVERYRDVFVDAGLTVSSLDELAGAGTTTARGIPSEGAEP